MKRIFYLAAAITFAACGQVELPVVEDEVESVRPDVSKTKAFTFHVKGDFVTDYAEMDGSGSMVVGVNHTPTDEWGRSNSRATTRLENGNTSALTDLWVLDYVDGVLVQSVHQASTEDGFGSVPMSLTYGHHDVKFVASKGDVPVLGASALSWSKVKDTFVLDYPVDVAASTNGNRAPELKRAVSGVTLVMTDVVPSNAKSIKVEYMRSQSLALPSLVASAASLSGVENDFPASWVGQTGSFSVYTLCPTDEMTTDVHVVVTAKDGTTISDFTVADVQLKKNRITTLKGECFGRGSGFSVSIDDSWDEPFEVTF